jgi:hypothetical protein
MNNNRRFNDAPIANPFANIMNPTPQSIPSVNDIAANLVKDYTIG